MAIEKPDFPRMPSRQWWALRNRFKQSIPATVTPDYLSTVLAMERASAKTNVLPALKKVGLVDEIGKPTELARRWRDDEAYSQVCKEMRQLVYPQDLLEAVPDPTSNKAAAERWFGNRTGAGASSINKMVSFYQLLSEANPTGSVVKQRPDSRRNTGPRKGQITSKSDGRQRLTDEPKPAQVVTAHAGDEPEAASVLTAQKLPAIHIDVQIHISPDATAEQIDQVFASMAKHLYGRSDK